MNTTTHHLTPIGDTTTITAWSDCAAGEGTAGSTANDRPLWKSCRCLPRRGSSCAGEDGATGTTSPATTAEATVQPARAGCPAGYPLTASIIPGHRVRYRRDEAHAGAAVTGAHEPMRNGVAGVWSGVAEVFATGMQMGESPRWHDGRFWMCDWLAGEVLVFDADGNREVVARVEGLPFSIDWLPDGRLVATTPGGVVVGPDLAPYGATGQPFNEIVVDAAGRAWVDMPGAMPWEEPQAGDRGRRAARREQPPASPTTCGSRTGWSSSATTRWSSPSRTPTG